jgi:hypothetical protein
MQVALVASTAAAPVVSRTMAVVAAVAVGHLMCAREAMAWRIALSLAAVVAVVAADP